MSYTDAGWQKRRGESFPRVSACCRKLGAAAALLLTLAGCANLEQRAYTAAATDTATTAIGLSLGLAEMNPMGYAVVALKLAALGYAETLPDGERAQFHSQAGSVWAGVSVSNACMIAALKCGPYVGVCAPACLVAGIGYGVYRWYADNPEREFRVACENYLRFSGEKLRCVWATEASE